MELSLSVVAKNALRAKGSILVLGGPGAGKTTLALLKAKSLLSRLLPEQKILFLSFSRAAVHQILQGGSQLLDRSELDEIEIKTYHAFWLDVLKAHGAILTGKPTSFLFPRQEKLLMSDFEGDWATERARLARDEGIFALGEFAPSCARLFDEANCVLTLLSDRYPVMVLDEFQDTSDTQWACVKQLARASEMIVLADPDQRIFDYDPEVNPERLNQLESAFPVQIFDLGKQNHRSPQTGVVDFADAVLRNRPLPNMPEVDSHFYHGRRFAQTLHQVVSDIVDMAGSPDSASESIAILCRSNAFAMEISKILDFPPQSTMESSGRIDHKLIWDAELSAAAAGVVATILEWPLYDTNTRVSCTLSALADYFKIKNALHPTRAARENSQRFQLESSRITSGKQLRTSAGKAIFEYAGRGIHLSGDPVSDWRNARDLIRLVPRLGEIVDSVRFVPLFHATDEIALPLRDQWRNTDNYLNAREIVGRALDVNQVISSQAEPKGVTVMNMHQSKGKEFDKVVIVEGSFKSKLLRENDPESLAPNSSDRRLLRVAITRAKRKVTILRPIGSVPLVDPSYSPSGNNASS